MAFKCDRPELNVDKGCVEVDFDNVPFQLNEVNNLKRTIDLENTMLMKQMRDQIAMLFQTRDWITMLNQMKDYIVINVGLNDELDCNVRLDEG